MRRMIQPFNTNFKKIFKVTQEELDQELKAITITEDGYYQLDLSFPSREGVLELDFEFPNADVIYVNKETLNNQPFGFLSHVLEKYEYDGRITTPYIYIEMDALAGGSDQQLLIYVCNGFVFMSILEDL